MKYYFNLAVLFFFAFSCQSPLKEKSTVTSSKPEKSQRPLAIENGKFFEMNGKQMLYGGKDSTWHFDISNSFLIDSQYHYGIGRERFHALIQSAALPKIFWCLLSMSHYPDRCHCS